RTPSAGPADAGSDAPRAEVAPPTSASAEPIDRPPGGEAIRSPSVRVDADQELAPHAAAVRARFGDAALMAQRATLTAGRTAVLLETPDEKTSMVLVLDRGALAWSKERPTAGMTPPARELAIVPHPRGGVVLFAYDEPARRVAMRIWTEEGA